MANNLLGTDIVVLSTATYREMLDQISKIEQMERAVSFQKSWNNQIEVKVDIAQMPEIVERAWDRFEGPKEGWEFNKDTDNWYSSTAYGCVKAVEQRREGDTDATECENI